MISWFAKNGVAANLLMGVILAGGFFSVKGLKVELFPEFDLDLITVTTLYPGAAPAEVEEGICKQVEEKIWDLTGIKELNSYSRENVGVVSIEVARGKDTEQLADEIKVRVDAIANFPEEAEKPMVEVVTAKRRVMAVAIHGECDEKTLRSLAEKMRDGLTAIPGITQVEIAGIRKPEIGIEVSERSLREHSLSFSELALENVFEESEVFYRRLYWHFALQCITGCYRVIGAAGFLGNPSGHVKHAVRGVDVDIGA